MSIYGSQSRHWSLVGQWFATDALLVFVSFYIAAALRFLDLQPPQFAWYLQSVLVCSLLLPSTIYIAGLYSEESLYHTRRKRTLMLFGAFCVMTLFVLAYGSVNFSARIGRGVLSVAVFLAACSVWIHHFLIQMQAKGRPTRLAFLIADETDEKEAVRLASCKKPHVKFVGLITALGYTPQATLDDLPVIGTLESPAAADQILDQVDCLVCRPTHLHSQTATALRKLRYRGARVITMVDAFEDLFHLVPLELVDEGWLLQVSAMPGVFYVRKLKRAFDLAAASALLLLLGPVCLVAMLIIRLGSNGPVIFRQERSGRFGRPFVVFKLRSMRIDAEVNGPQWSVKNDPRVTWFGSFLRKYRIDEIPQLINVMRGEMSFVGPRPERPQFVAELGQVIPYYDERLLLQPGLTGWAQVRYAYGSTVDDARRKLEYDFYYLKHMSLFLDAFILLDTVRTVIRGVSYSGGYEALVAPRKQPVEASMPLPSEANAQ